jgi:8-oxo-dGTP pyrophosphatase MutT (NUDIX family)
VPAELRPAATVILLRDGPEGPEVWLMERNRSVAFMASAWVFPGGRVDPGDAELPVEGEPSHDIPRAFWTAALRELEEEAGVRLGGARYDLGSLRPWSHWLTPEVEPRRYDTWFFVARLPPGAEARHDGEEAVAGGWFTPAAAIDRATSGTLPVAPPTLRTLFELAEHRTVDAVFAASRRLVPVCPKFQQGEDGVLYVLLPGDPEHPSPDAVDPPYRYVFEAGRWWAR